MLTTCIHCKLEVDYDPETDEATRRGNPDCWDAPRRPCQGCDSNGEDDQGCHDCSDTGNSWMGLHAVAPILRLDEDARAVIAGLVAPSSEVNADGITASDAVWERIRAAFPVESFHAWVQTRTADPTSGNSYDHDA